MISSYLKLTNTYFELNHNKLYFCLMKIEIWYDLIIYEEIY